MCCRPRMSVGARAGRAALVRYGRKLGRAVVLRSGGRRGRAIRCAPILAAGLASRPLSRSAADCAPLPPPLPLPKVSHALSPPRSHCRVCPGILQLFCGVTANIEYDFPAVIIPRCIVLVNPRFDTAMTLAGGAVTDHPRHYLFRQDLDITWPGAAGRRPPHSKHAQCLRMCASLPNNDARHGQTTKMPR